MACQVILKSVRYRLIAGSVYTADVVDEEENNQIIIQE